MDSQGKKNKTDADKKPCAPGSKGIRLIDRRSLYMLLNSLSDKYTVFIPKNEKGVIHYSQFRNDNLPEQEYHNYFIPPDKFFCFDPVWKQFADFDFDAADFNIEESAVLFGVRPCDAHSLVLLDKAIQDNEFYRTRRNNMFIIVIGCNSPNKNCFCTSVNGSPFSHNAADIFITDLGDDLMVEDISGRLTEHLHFLPFAGHDVLKRKHEKMKMSEGIIGVKYSFEPLYGKLERLEKMEASTRDSIWKELSGKCSNCGMCIAICPTCHCCLIVNDIVDMVIDEIGEKAREFDPCILNIFISAGLNGPVPSGYQRLQRRVMDKFFHSVKNLGQPFCVGCGRCITYCPEDINLKKILIKLDELA
jgi:ferredoxin